jgi:hypothetical protein
VDIGPVIDPPRRDVTPILDAIYIAARRQPGNGANCKSRPRTAIGYGDASETTIALDPKSEAQIVGLIKDLDRSAHSIKNRTRLVPRLLNGFRV